MSGIEDLNTAYDPFADLGPNETGTNEGDIHLRVQQRNGRKMLTTVEGIPVQYDLKRVLKALKKEFACNGNIPPNKPGTLILNGDQRGPVADFLINQLLIPKEHIKKHGF